jgi:cardiolipin synthase (CMP-forming)
LTRRARPYTRADLTLANAFTALRLLLTPLFAWTWLRGDNWGALWLFAVAVVTDLLDGFCARYLNQASRLGALLDPIADKLLMLVALLVGARVGAIPVWLAAAVIGRDTLLTAALVVRRSREVAGRPTRIGKYAMFLQSASIAGSLVEKAMTPPGLMGYLQVIMIATAATTLVAGAQYTVRAAFAIRARVPRGS